MKVLHFIPNLRKGGAERLVLDICTELQKHENVTVQLITFAESNEYRELTKRVNHRVIASHFQPSISGKSSTNIKALQEYISGYQPDIIHSHLWESEIVLSQIHSSAIRFSHFHDNMPQLRKVRFPISKKDFTDGFEKRIIFKGYRRNNVNFICISEDTFSYAKNVLPNLLLGKINLIHNGIDFDHFYSPVKAQKKQLSLINIGSFVKKKNQKLAIQITADLIDEKIPCDLVLLGDGPLREDLVDYAEQLNILDHVHFMGNIDNVAEHLSKASIYLHTALSEPFGLVLLEAMAAGLPIVSLDGKGNRDIINNGVNGYIISETNVERFTKTILMLRTNQVLYKEIATAGQITAKEYDISSCVKNLLEIYLTSISSVNKV